MFSPVVSASQTAVAVDPDVDVDGVQGGVVLRDGRGGVPQDVELPVASDVGLGV